MEDVTAEEIPQASESRAGLPVSTILTVTVGVILVGLLAFGFFSSKESERPQPGEPAPDFVLALLDGSEISKSDLNDQVLVFNFWASWCTVCRQEAPALQQTWEMYREEDVTFLGVTYQDARDASLAFLDEFGITYANGIDENGRMSRAYGVVAVPETFIVDRDGQIAAVYIGEVQPDELVAQIERLRER
jgi:cytochrome c biogenesis protein CcmG, thiol:disulfide interchange protein DsbE